MTGRARSKWVEPVYLDTSALIKLFVPEPESDLLNQALVGAADVVISDLALTEMASALGRRTRERLLTSTEARRLLGEAERLATACRRAELTPPTHRRAQRLLLTSGSALRSLDALHIALAMDAGAATMVTFDSRLAAVASGQHLFAAPETTAEIEAAPPGPGLHVARARCAVGVSPGRSALRRNETDCQAWSQRSRRRPLSEQSFYWPMGF